MFSISFFIKVSFMNITSEQKYRLMLSLHWEINFHTNILQSAEIYGYLIDSHEYKWVLTDANGGKESDTLIWWVTLRKERLASINWKGQRHNSLTARPDDDALHPQSNEGQKRAKWDHNVGVISSRFLNHATQFSVAIGAHHTENATYNPHHQSHVHWSCFFKNSWGADENARTDNRTWKVFKHCVSCDST